MTSLGRYSANSLPGKLIATHLIRIDERADTFRYDEVRTAQINHLVSARFGGEEGATKNLCDKIDEKVDAYVAGDLKHATETMSLLWEVSKKDRSTNLPIQSFGGFVRVTSSPTPLPLINFARSQGLPAATAGVPAAPECLKPAFIRSIREGVFVDRKYFARYSKAGKALRPVYFPSTVIGEKLAYIDKRE